MYLFVPLVSPKIHTHITTLPFSEIALFDHLLEKADALYCSDFCTEASECTSNRNSFEVEGKGHCSCHFTCLNKIYNVAIFARSLFMAFQLKIITKLLIRALDFSKSGFGPRTVMKCDQCEKEYHVGCLKEHKMDQLKEVPKEKWFCCTDCERIHSVLQKLVAHGEKKLPEPLLNALKKMNGGKDSEGNFNVDVRWRLLSCNMTSDQTRVLFSRQSLSSMHKVVDFHWNVYDPWTIVSVSDDVEASSGGCYICKVIVHGISIEDNYQIILASHSSLGRPYK